MLFSRKKIKKFSKILMTENFVNYHTVTVWLFLLTDGSLTSTIQNTSRMLSWKITKIFHYKRSVAENVNHITSKEKKFVKSRFHRIIREITFSRKSFMKSRWIHGKMLWNHVFTEKISWKHVFTERIREITFSQKNFVKSRLFYGKNSWNRVFT